MYFSPFRTVYKRSQYSVLSSVQGTQGMTTAWIFATTVVLALERFYFHIPRPKILSMIFFMHYLHFNVLTTDK
jgi:hypothetical protein